MINQQKDDLEAKCEVIESGSISAGNTLNDYEEEQGNPVSGVSFKSFLQPTGVFLVNDQENGGYYMCSNLDRQLPLGLDINSEVSSGTSASMLPRRFGVLVNKDESHETPCYLYEGFERCPELSFYFTADSDLCIL